MLDIHNHILPGVDDGAKSIEESIEMANIYLKNGIEKIIATPHYIEGNGFNTKEENAKVLEKLRDVFNKEEIDLKVYLGNEIFVSPDIFKYLEEERVATLNDSRYVLIEMPMLDVPVYMENIIYELCLKGYIPIIAHPERNMKIIENPNILFEFVMGGALAQVNLPSLEGKYGEGAKKTGEIILTHNLAHFVGTDAHSPRRRSPDVSRSLIVLKQLVDENKFQELTCLNIEAVLEDKDIFVDEPIKYREEKKSFFSFLKSKISIF